MAYKGMYLKKTVPTDIKEALWWEEHCIVRQGGYDLDQSNLPAGLKWLPKGTVVKLTSAGKATVVKTAKVTEKATSGTKTVKVASGSLIAAGDTLAGSKVASVTTGTTIDTITLSTATTADIEENSVISDFDADSDTILGFTYATKEIDADASQTVEPTLQAVEVEEESLPYPINDEIKKGLNANGVALFKIQ